MSCKIPYCDFPVFAKGMCSRHYQAERKYGDPNVVKQKQHHGLSLAERFFRYVGKRPDCWFWAGGKDSRGYGRMNVQGRPVLAHRVSYQIQFGPIPNGMNVLHRCDNPQCVNPEHLFLGTQADNVDDMHNKGRAKKRVLVGERHGNAKLTESDVRAIRGSDKSASELARMFDVSRAVIYSVQNFQTWKHVDKEN